VVPLSPAEPLSIAVARLAKGGSSQSGTTSSNPPSSSGESLANSTHGFGDPPPASRDFALSVPLRGSVIDAWDRQR
jgi:hypothetical protein